MLEKLNKATPSELLAWMFGAGVLGLGIGALLYGYIGQFALWVILIGAVIHGWAMYRIYLR